MAVGGWTWWDLLAAAIFVAASPFTEWLMHRFILHGKAVRFGRIDLGNGVDHAKHHDDPPQIEWLLLSASDATTNQIALAALVAVTTALPMWLLGAPIAAPTLTVGVLTAARLLEYEWNHFLFHTAYRPRGRRYQRLKQSHRLHHYRNENYWMGVTNTFGDRVFGTYKAKADVELSPTARNLEHARR